MGIARVPPKNQGPIRMGWPFLIYEKKWSRQESNLHLRFRKPTYYPLYYETLSLERTKPTMGRLWGCSGGRTRTSDLRVMSPTSYQLLYPAIIDRQRYDLFLCSPNYGRYLWPMMRLGVSWASWTTSYEPNRPNPTRSDRLAAGFWP